MSEPTQVAQVENQSFQPKSEDLAKKQISIPGIGVYHIVMRQNRESRFFIIQEVKEQASNSRIIVPMDHSQEFLEKLNEVLKFEGQYSSEASATTSQKGSAIVFTASMHTDAGRRYYFDVIDKDSILNLKMSYIYDDRRDSIIMDLGSLIYFVDVVEIFQKDYPSLTGQDDFQHRRNYRSDKRRDTKRRSRVSNTNSGSSIEAQPSYNYNQNLGESASRTSGRALKICSDPGPHQITYNAKKYIFEIVEGINTFLRITEVIGDSRKSTIHVPVGCLNEVQSVIADMNDRYMASHLP